MDFWVNYQTRLKERRNTCLRFGNDALDFLQMTDDLLGFSLTRSGEDDRKEGRKTGEVELGEEEDAEGIDGDTGMNTNTDK